MATGKPKLQESYRQPDLAERLKAYRNRTGEFKNKKGGAAFTQPVVDELRTEKRSRAETNAAGRNYAKTYRANAPQRKARGEAYRADEVKRREEYAKTGRVTTGVGRSPGAQSPIASTPMGPPPRGSGNYRPSPLVRSQQPMVYAPQGPLPPDGYGGGYDGAPPSYRRTGELQTSAPVGGGYQPPEARPSMFTPQQEQPPAFQAFMPQQSHLMQPPQYMQPLPSSGYRPPQGNPNVQPMTAMQMYNNPWGRKW